MGKRIYREKTDCDCHTCNRVLNEGIVVGDEDHAEYLYLVQNELGIKYFEQRPTKEL